MPKPISHVNPQERQLPGSKFITVVLKSEAISSVQVHMTPNFKTCLFQIEGGGRDNDLMFQPFNIIIECHELPII